MQQYQDWENMYFADTTIKKGSIKMNFPKAEDCIWNID